ncbi:MAG TPA: hypothetical protein PLR76_15070, partial [Hyphomonas sp.]|nr:hypothetical protein [Hyphomonas sp.]
ERGPEMFVPNTAGIIVPNSQLNPNTDTSSVRSGGSAQMNFIVQGNITEEVFPRVQQMFTEFARQVPGMVDARVIDRKKRGAY